MGTLHAVPPAQTLYVTVRRDELRQLKDERDQLKQELAQLRLLLNGNQAQPLPVTLRAPHA
jgi:ribosomal protein L29